MKYENRFTLPKSEKRRILIVDDDKEFADSLVDILEFDGYMVEVAHSAEGGLDKTKRFDAQVALIDIRLGKSNGISLLAEMKKTCPKIICVMMTAYAATDTAIKALQKGAYDYLRKPLDADDLLAILNRCFEKLQLGEAKAAAETDLRISNEELQRKHQIQSALNDMLSIALSPFELVEILDRILDHIASISWLTMQSKGIIFLVEDHPDELVMRSYRNIDNEFVSLCSRIPFGRCLCGQAASTDEIVFADCIDDRHENRYENISSHGHYCVPIVSSGNVLGVLTLFLEEGHRQNKEEEEFLQAVANGLAGIIERKRAEEALRNALSEVKQLQNRLQAENIYLQDEINIEYNFGEIICQNKQVRKILRKVEKVAPTSTTVLILGETGTGKELIARAIHNLGNRNERPLVKVNCAALPANLIESELFGHEKGAFTGASNRKIGRFELADGGTIFLDEIGDLPLELQTKLLRVLQEGELERLGSSHTIKVNVRVIAATNRDLEKAIAAGDFRQDLFYRLNVFPIKALPLREHIDDIPLLVDCFVKKFSAKIGRKIESIPINVMSSLQAYHWPGNVRELENIIERTVILTSGSTLELSEEMFDHPSKTINQDENSITFKEAEQSVILKALSECQWVIRGKHGAAAHLSIPASTLRDKMKKHGIKKPQ